MVIRYLLTMTVIDIDYECAIDTRRLLHLL